MKFHQLLFCGALSVLNMENAQALNEGSDVPACSIASLGNSDAVIELSQLRGQVVYVDFWASWCGPCAKSFPFMNTLHASFKDHGLKIIAVNVDEQVADAEAFLRQQPAEFSIALDAEQMCAKSFDVQAMPSTYLVDRKGKVRYVHMGFRSSEAENLESQVKRLLSESP